jgi:hypothetical protein
LRTPGNAKPDPIRLRVVRRERREARGTLVLFFMHGGLGDRVIFEGLVRHWMGVASATKRIVAAIPPNGDDYYDARSYSTSPDEVWIVDGPHPDTVFEVAERVHLAATEALASAGEVATLCFGPPLDKPPHIPRLTWREPYGDLQVLAREATIFPRFSTSEAARIAGVTWRERLTSSAAGAPVVAIHCRVRSDSAGRDMSPEDMMAVADALKRRVGARIVAFGTGDIPPELSSRADALLAEFDPALDRSAGLLARCDLFIGGESGPLHLAAALRVPIVLVSRAGRGGGRWGPFVPPELWREIRGEPRQPSGPLRFDPEEALRAASVLLERFAKAPERLH